MTKKHTKDGKRQLKNTK